MIGTPPTGFEVFWQDFLNIAYPAVQMVYWSTMTVVAIVAVRLFKRLVDAKMSSATSDDDISIEEFVD